MINAKQIAAKSSSNAVSLEDYLTSRITQAAERGFPSTLIWIKDSNYEEAIAMLRGGGYSFEVVQRDVKGTQLNVSW